MIIEYTDTARCKELKGKDYTAFYYFRKRNTNVVDELWQTIETNTDKAFDEMYDILKVAYKNRKSKSRIDIYKSDIGIIEVTNKGVFPNILIQKTK